ncbi:thap domain-containing protein [Lasius niger]|uniref:Thap domain-containing protein n=1 Tax=Lasius niger TaxID=67767 RepID=A0A0J7KMB7_LASNI|nr:thap domain-containing protein [Lasius niger]
MVRCLVPSCKNTSEIRDWKKRIDTGEMRKKVSFHSFPKDPATRNLWIDILKLDAASIPVAARICSDHFKEEDYDKRTLIARLFRNALPIAIQV